MNVGKDNVTPRRGEIFFIIGGRGLRAVGDTCFVPYPPLHGVFQAQYTEGCNYLRCLSKVSPTPQGLLSVLLKSKTTASPPSVFPLSSVAAQAYS